jgi:uncharacterized protein (DUF2267 family)
MEKRDAYKVLRAVLQTLRDRLPMNDAVHFAAQLPMFLRGLFFESWQPSSVPIKMSREEFLKAISEKVITDHRVDPLRITEIVFSAIMTHVGVGEMEKIKHCLPKDLRSLWPGWTPTL